MQHGCILQASEITALKHEREAFSCTTLVISLLLASEITALDDADVNANLLR